MNDNKGRGGKENHVNHGNFHYNISYRNRVWYLSLEMWSKKSTSDWLLLCMLRWNDLYDTDLADSCGWYRDS